MKENIKFSVLLCVYYKDNCDHFKAALESVVSQTLIPNELVIVCDGKLTTALDKIINEYEKKYKFIKVCRIKKNSGHGNARRLGIDTCSNNLIALMDADDISVKDRFEKQIKIFEKYPDISVVGGYIYEFIDSVENIIGSRELPEKDKQIKEYMKKRCPMNQVTVMFKKDAVISSGNYIDWYCEEDYYLWIRMAEHNYRFYNIQENLVYVRVGNEMYSRRGGIKYYKSEKRVQKYMYDNKIINFFEYQYNILIRFVAEVILPNGIRGFLYKRLLRNKK